jgi:hypothetical protein
MAPRLRAARPVAAALAFAVLATAGHSAFAVDSSEYLISPIVNQGEREVDWQFGVGSPGPQTHSDIHSGIGLGWGATDRWYTELSLDYHKHSGRATAPDEVEWENVVQLAEQDEWPIDVGLAFSLGKSLSGSKGLSMRFGPLLQKEFGKFQANFNLLFERRLGRTSDPVTQARYQGQLKYRYSQPLEFGVQAFGDLGSSTQLWAPYSQQVHRVGPVLLGRFNLPRERSISYNAAVLFGTTAHSPDRTLRIQIEYEF